MQKELASDGTFPPLSGNRLSVNIAPGGFPYTQAQYESGSVNANGVQMTAGYPSYILQAYVIPFLIQALLD